LIFASDSSRGPHSTSVASGYIPSRIAPGGERLANAGGAMTDADVAMLPHGVGELGETAMLARDDESAGSFAVLMRCHHSSSA
jgi:hypothetical protein